MKPIYLDHAATTPLDPRVFEVMEPYLREQFANPSSLYGAARQTRQALEDARAAVANLLGAKLTEIVWTSGGTESVNLAIQGVLQAHQGATWVATAIEHDAVLANSPDKVVPVKSSGVVDPEAVIASITDQTVLVSVMLANNEIGMIQPVADIAKAVAQIRADRTTRGVKLPLYLHTDACQAPGYLNLQVARLGVDLLSLNGSKIYGPKGSGLLYDRTGTILEPLLRGGGQERGRRSGTENVAAAVGLAKALELATAEREAESHRQAALRDNLWQKLQQSLPDAILNGDLKRRLPNNLNLTIPGVDGQTLVLYLDKAGIMASTGSACSSSSQLPSHVLLALGLTPEQATSSLRLTLGCSTTTKDVEYVAEQLPQIVARLRQIA